MYFLRLIKQITKLNLVFKLLLNIVVSKLKKKKMYKQVKQNKSR